VVLPAGSGPAVLAAVDEVHTLTSLTGFEALLRELPVVTYGAPFYAGWGLTVDRVRLPRRTRRLSLDQLVAGALILYPAYVDPVTGLPCDAETAVSRLCEARERASERRPRRRLRALVESLRTLARAAGPPGLSSTG
jgi:capsular polysaccharide export protein